MNLQKNQLILLIAGAVVLFSLFFFGKTSLPHKEEPIANTQSLFSIDSLLTEQKATLTPAQQVYLATEENKVKRGDVHSDQIKNYELLANYYKDTLKTQYGYLHYTAEAAKLENSEKKLTFAAQLFLGVLKTEHDPARLGWLTNNSIDLFKKALVLSPNNTDLKIGLGSAYVYGNGQTGDATQVMTGIQQLLQVVRTDSTNLKAQLVLGVGGFVSGQYDKAIPRLLSVIAKEPDNIEAVAFLADTYAAMGNKPEAIRWYERSKALVKDPGYSKEVDERIKNMK